MTHICHMACTPQTCICMRQQAPTIIQYITPRPFTLPKLDGTGIWEIPLGVKIQVIPPPRPEAMRAEEV